MATSFDVAGRLAEGLPVVDDLSEYVLACHRLGYQNPDLTAHTSQVRDWYDGETGLDLRALDADCAALAAAADAAEDAARVQTDLVAGLSEVWAGGGAVAAREFARRSGQAATSVSSSLRRAAEAVATLRDELWRAVDAKVATVQAIDGRHRAERGEWLSAARTVATGAGDLAAASELVDRHVKPFVQNDVGSDFVGAMRVAGDSINAAYDALIAKVSSTPHATFDVPGELGPRITSVVDVKPGSGIAAVASTTPSDVGIPTTAATFSPAPAPPSSSFWPEPPPVVEPAGSAPLTSPAAAAAPAPSMPAIPSTGDLGGAAPALGAGVSGFGQQLAELIGSLVGSFSGTEDLAGIDGAVDDSGDDRFGAEGDEGDEGDKSDVADDDDEEQPPDDESDDGSEADQSTDESTEQPSGEVVGEAPAESVPTPVPPSAPDGVPDAPPPAPESVVETPEKTPCEIAADELPQVGE